MKLFIKFNIKRKRKKKGITYYNTEDAVISFRGLCMLHVYDVITFRKDMPKV